MLSKIIAGVAVSLLCLGVLVTGGQGGEKKKAQKPPKKTTQVWTSADDPSLPADYKFQGEYVGEIAGVKGGAQVIALGDGQFQAVLLPGGLPGAGWDGKNKSLLSGKLDGARVILAPAAGKRKYLAQSPDEFSATAKFPPVGQRDYAGAISGDTLTLTDGKLTKIERKSPTLGMAPPKGAIVLFDGSNTSEFSGGRLDKTTGLLNTDGNNITTKRKFNDYAMHLEFLLPFRPGARGQGRGNSGFYQVLQYEVQILDSFGLEGKNNECGGIYSRIDPRINMCLPPLTWQTYDVDFTNAVGDGKGKVTQKARLTLKLNGVVIHDNIEIPGPTGGSRQEPEGTPGALLLQGHGNPLQFRNIWLVEK